MGADFGTHSSRGEVAFPLGNAQNTSDGERDVYFVQHMHWNLPREAGGREGNGRLYHSRRGDQFSRRR